MNHNLRMVSTTIFGATNPCDLKTKVDVCTVSNYIPRVEDESSDLESSVPTQAPVDGGIET